MQARRARDPPAIIGPVEPGAEDAVEVSRVDLDRGEVDLGTLSASERERMQRLRSPELARRWAAGRSAMRAILATRLGVEPARVRLTSSEHGRPQLDREAHPVELDFNFSHSAGLGLLAVAERRRVGVDVEGLRRGRDPLPIAERYFAPDELAALGRLPPAERGTAFFRYWTAKEALAKGLGLGLKAPLRELELGVRFDGGLEPRRLGAGWQLLGLSELPDGYCAALASDAPVARVEMRDWAP